MMATAKVRLLQVAVTVIALFLVSESAGLRKDSLLNEGLKYRELTGQLPTIKASSVQQIWLEQPQDHFDQSNTNTWLQQVFINDEYFNPKKQNPPILLFLGGEGPLRNTSVGGSYITNTVAQELGGLLIAAEHRFYGKSMPAPDLSLNNLKYLTSQQALADFVNVARWAKAKYCSTCPVITIGGSYSGSLSAWMRLLYPEDISIAWSSSAPVEARVDYKEYYTVVAKVLGKQCTDTVLQGSSWAEQLLNTESGRQTLTSKFQACDTLPASSNDFANFMMNGISDPISGVVQYNNNNSNSKRMKVPQLCSMLEQDDIEESLPRAIKKIAELSGQNCTYLSYASTLAQLKDVRPNSEYASTRAWTWQTCNEFGYFQTGAAPNIPFSKLITLDFYYDICKEVYGVDANTVDQNIIATNKFYGAKSIPTITDRTIYVNGEADPWHLLGILEQPNTDKENYVFVISSTSHCADIYAPADGDPPALTETRKAILNIIKNWLNQM